LESFELRFQNIQTRRNNLEARSLQTLLSMHNISCESQRVTDYAYNVKQILYDFDAEFERQTGLAKKDE
jgi:hypothetical protein